MPSLNWAYRPCWSMTNQNHPLTFLPRTKTLVIVNHPISYQDRASGVVMLKVSKSCYARYTSRLRKSRLAHSHREQSSYGRREDLISQLPDHLLHQILSKLQTEDSVKTSLLSSRWRYVWKSVPGLDINCNDFHGYDPLMSFVNSFLDWDQKSPIYQLKLNFDREKYEIEGSDVQKWINSVVTRGVQHLVVDASFVCDVASENCLPLELPLSIWKCETLVHLKLNSVHLPSFELVSLPRLETMHLSQVWFPRDSALEKLISSSQVLQVLEIRRIKNVKVWRVRSQTLRSLTIRAWNRSLSQYDLTNGLVIDAPVLNSLSLDIGMFIDIALNSLCSPTKMDIDLSRFFLTANLSSIASFRNLIAAILKATNLTLNSYTLQAIYTDWRHVPLPIFSNLTHLKVSFCPYGFDLLFKLLARCPNMKSLDLEISGFGCGSIPRSYMPDCLLTSLEVVDIRWLLVEYPVESTLVKYFLRNAEVLTMLTLCLPHVTKEEKHRVVRKILKFPRRSSTCQIFVPSCQRLF